MYLQKSINMQTFQYDERTKLHLDLSEEGNKTRQGYLSVRHHR